VGQVYHSAVRARGLAFIFPLALALGCTKTGQDTKDKSAEPRDAPPAIRVTRDRQDLIFSYARPDGSGFETATTIDQIPEASRRAVVVTDLSLTPEQRQSGRYVYIADLRAARPDGTYPVAVASRYGFEAGLAAGTSTLAPGLGGGREVIVYSASWCGVCKQTKRLLSSLNVRFVEKDIEASRSAAEELAKKARAAGFQPGGVPVIDVAGTILQGLDEPTLRSVLKDKGFI
jgi:glutaredoxin